MVELRFFAAARDAVGASTLSVEGGTLAAIMGRFDSPVVARCSLLVNGIAVTDPTLVVTDGDSVDVLPPFAGG